VTVDREKLKRACKLILEAIRENPARAGLEDTPRRFADLWQEFIEYDPGHMSTTFDSITTDQMVVVSGIRVWSLCEHHLLPFWCDLAIGYIARDRILGLSKFGRIAHAIAHRLQVQERLVHEIADRVSEIAGTEDVAVLGSGEHLCMTMRGIKAEATMTTSVMRGLFFSDERTRGEFLALSKCR
jgi:GTP cyclohydrolase I